MSTATPDTASIAFAESVIGAQAWAPTPLLRAYAIGERLGCEVWLKREDCTPIGSFKLRGAMVTVRALAPGAPAAGVCIASAGNYGIAIAYACADYGIPVTVVTPQGATPSKVERIRTLGGSVVTFGDDFDAAKSHAKAIAAETGSAFWEDGSIEQMATGAGTIASELLRDGGRWDAVIVPLGNGSLIKGIARQFRRRSPDTEIIAVAPGGAPAMAQALKRQPWDECAAIDTLADGLAVRVPIPGMMRDLDGLIDRVSVAAEDALLPAVRTLLELEQALAEPSAATPIVALAENADRLRGKRVAAIITGSHLNPALLGELASTKGLL